jgi:lipid II:glycine glycyltransferase (peptidoglycan interpeptide bridge formation enzyme)
MGWQVRAFRCGYRADRQDEEQEFLLLLLIRSLPLGLKLAYVPHGPELEVPVGERERLLLDLTAALKPYLSGCLFVRFDLPWGEEGLGNPPPALVCSTSLHKAPLDVQPPSTVILDLLPEEDELLGAMKSKTRYNIRLSAKKGVDIDLFSAGSGKSGNLEEELAAWYSLYRETARRDRITLHSWSYYKRLFATAGTYGDGASELYLLTARHQGQLLAGIIVAVKGEGAWYLYGASSNQKRNLMPSYGLQWRAVQLVRERGCQFYDLFGIPATDDPNEPMHGLFRFKTGFGGRVINRPGCYDVSLRPLLYRLYHTAEALRTLYYRRWRKKLSRG